MFEKLIALQNFLSALSWVKLAQLTLLVFILMITVGVYSSRDSIINAVTSMTTEHHPALVKKLANESLIDLTNIPGMNPNVVGVVVTTVDMQKNTQYIVHNTTTVPDIKDIFDQNAKIISSELPLFSAVNAGNKTIIEIINGKFLCVPFSTSPFVELLPDASKFVMTVCGSSIPPIFGKFNGMVIFFVKKNLTPTEMDHIRILLLTTATELYEKNYHK